MASFQAPPGHLSQAEVLIISGLVEYQLTVNAPDADLAVSVGTGSSWGRWERVPEAPGCCCRPSAAAAPRAHDG